jgi:hypothetical protein
MIRSEWQLPYLVQQLELAPNILDGLENTSLLLYLDAKNLTRHDAPAACIPKTVVVDCYKELPVWTLRKIWSGASSLNLELPAVCWIGSEANDQ